jgi:predicted benzoate:H+ symporter BenE
MVRHNQSMMVTGIVLVAVSPVALLVAGIAGFGKALCQIDNDHPASCRDYDPALYGSLIATAVLVGVGVPLLVIGARKEPASPALRGTIQPWASSRGAGLALRLDL